MLNPLIPRTDAERIADLEKELDYVQTNLSEVYAEKDNLHRIVADQKDLIRTLCRYILDEMEEWYGGR